jgi:hypothetical protein
MSYSWEIKVSKQDNLIIVDILEFCRGKLLPPSAEFGMPKEQIEELIMKLQNAIK